MSDKVSKCDVFVYHFRGMSHANMVFSTICYVYSVFKRKAHNIFGYCDITENCM